jgi:murein DD-endopeptidase MepM/ murein hydrolase activator NlpD
MKFICLLLFFSSVVFSQKEYPKDYFRSPLDIPMQLSGNFGELRPNHFHAGFDFKTQKKEGLSVFAVADGYVSRIKISTFGYGKAIYITHPNGYTSVYGHLKIMAPSIENFCKKEQYKLRSFEMDIYLKPDDLLVKKSDLIAFSGNTGGSDGPHLHFEIRDSSTEKIINPIFFGFDNLIKDSKKPTLTTLFAYPLNENTTINQSRNPVIVNLTLQKDGNYLADPLLANGKIGFGINVYDGSDFSWDKNGIYKAALFLNGVAQFGYEFDTFSFEESRYINALIDYPRYKSMGQRVQKLFMKTPYNLSLIKLNQENGAVNVTSNVNQIGRIEVSDYYQNKTQITIPIEMSNLPALDSLKSIKTPYLIKTFKEYNFEKENWSVYFPPNTFYDDFYLKFDVQNSLLHLPNKLIPVHTNFKVSVVDSIATDEEKQKMYIATFDDKKWLYNFTKLYKNTFSTYTKNWGQFKLLKDTIAPKISILKVIEGKWLTGKKHITFSIKDTESGIQKYEGYLNNKWMLFEYDYKSNSLIHDLDDGIAIDGKNELKLIITDNVGNSAIFETHFFRSIKP